MNNLWEIFTAKEEYNFPLKDKFNRNLTSYTKPFNLLEPVVSQHFVEEGFVPNYPEGRAFATCVSHDIDNLFTQYSNTQILKSALKLNFKRFSRQLKSKISAEVDSDFDLKNIMDIDDKYGVNADYYFLSTTKDNPQDHNYDLEQIRYYFPEILSRNNKIGLHGSRLVSEDQNELHIEKNRLRQYTPKFRGYRSHYLKFKVPDTWQILAAEGIDYDTTYGAASSPGFRNGMCYPFQPYDLIKKDWIDIYEIPLVAMDVSFFRYQNLTFDGSFELFKILVDKVKECKGVFSFLWHNNYVTGEMREFYELCLNHLQEQNTWFATGEEVIDWWKENNYFDQQKKILTACKKK